MINFAPKKQRMAHFLETLREQATFGRAGQSDEYRREELIRIIEHSIQKLTLQELESLYYDMSTKQYIND